MGKENNPNVPRTSRVPGMATNKGPVHRVSSRFTYIRCSKSGPKTTINKTFTFREEAHRICLVSEEGNRDQWSSKTSPWMSRCVYPIQPRLSVPVLNERKGPAVIARFAIAVCIDLEEKATAHFVEISQYTMYLSCSGPVVMDFDTIVSPMIVYGENG